MLIQCKNNSAKALSVKALRVSGTDATEFPLIIGKKYTVFAICLWQGVLKYLIIGEQNLPMWYPSELFDVVEKTLPFEWYCDIVVGQALEAIWGYKEMVYDNCHFDALQERDSKAVKIFLKRKAEIETNLTL